VCSRTNVEIGLLQVARLAVTPHKGVLLLTDNSYDPLGMHKCDCNAAWTPLDWCRSSQLREQLVEEIHALDRQLEILRGAESSIDFSLQQTCREMIHSRQKLFQQLRR
jgi:hypothetical protein